MGGVSSDPVDNLDHAGADGPIEYRCPRCDSEVSAQYYGPCETCRATLRATVDADGP